MKKLLNIHNLTLFPNRKVAALLLLINLNGLIVIAQPIITSFSPMSGPIGTVVTITGTNFNLTSENNIVFFGSTRALVNTANSTSLEVTVPSGASYEPISVTDLSTSLTAYSSKVFNVTFPFCSNFNPNSYKHNLDIHFEPYAYKVLISDFDGDGLSDILLVKYGGLISIYRNTSSIGNISFDQKLDFPATNYPHDAAIKDLNGDGKPDLVISHGYENRISYYKNISTSEIINFEPKVEREVWYEPHSISIEDMDTDGKPDLIVTYSYHDDLNIFSNTSSLDSISFAFAANIESKRGYITICDLDGDKKPDIARSNTYNDGILLYLNTSEAGETSLSFTGNVLDGKKCNYISSCDLNLDGKQDLITEYESWPDSIAILTNTSSIGNITFGPFSKYPSSLGKELGFADVDGNGTPDITSIHWSDSIFNVILNNSTPGNLILEPKIEFSMIWEARSLSIADMDLDGRPDYVIANEYYNTYPNEYKLSVLRNYAIPPAPEICMVTVDSTSTNNIIYWDNTLYTGVDSMIVYRETTSNDYKKIGAKKIDDSNFFIDTTRQLYFPYTGDPNIGSYRYKLQRRDTCGSYSELGPYHNTIFIANNGSGFYWNHYEIEGLPSPIPQMNAYHLLRKKNNLFSPWKLIGGVASSQSSLNDPDYDIYPNDLRKVETQWNINCTNYRNNNKSSYSNIIGVISNNNLTENENVIIYPNPFKSKALISSQTELNKATIRLFNSIGMQVMQIEGISGNTYSLHRDKLQSGIYFIYLIQENEIIARKKIIIY